MQHFASNISICKAFSKQPNRSLLLRRPFAQLGSGGCDKVCIVYMGRGPKFLRICTHVIRGWRLVVGINTGAVSRGCGATGAPSTISIVNLRLLTFRVL